LIAEYKIPDATPGMIVRYALSEEQELLARLRYNRLIDTFTGITCYSLQNCLRATVAGLGYVETDEVYVGVDRRGSQYVIPVHAKGETEALNTGQVERDIALANEKFPGLLCRPIGAQFIDDSLIALFEFELTDVGVRKWREHHYRLVSYDEMSGEVPERYRLRTIE